MDDEIPEDGDSADEHDSEPEQPIILKTMAAFMKQSKEGTPIARLDHTRAPVDDDSVTGKCLSL